MFMGKSAVRSKAVFSMTITFVVAAMLQAAPAPAGDTVYYYSSDAIHSEVVVTDQNRNVVERTYYAPYGQVLNRDLRDGPGYTGHEEDPETGLVYMQQRYYCPECGRFLSVDPVGVDPTSGANFNRYEYVKDNPYRYTDPFGLYECSGSKSDCQTINKFVDTLHKALSNLSKGTDAYSRVSKVSAYIGELGDKNGVTLSAGKLGPDVVAQAGKGGNITVDLKNASSVSAYYQKYNPSLGTSSMRSAIGAASVAHEARHEIDYENPAIGYPANEKTENRTELNAYWTEVGVDKGLGVSTGLYSPGATPDSIKDRVFDAAAGSTQYWCSHGGSCP